MRRLLVILLMLLVPLQSAWSAGHAFHVDHVASADSYVHSHDHDHDHDVDQGDWTSDATGTTGSSEHGDNSHHGSHVHPAFTVILPDRSVVLTEDSPALPPPSRSASFTSHSPPLFDRPPSVRA